MTLFQQADQAEEERRSLDNTLRVRVQELIDAARLEGFNVGFRAGREVEECPVCEAPPTEKCHREHHK